MQGVHRKTKTDTFPLVKIRGIFYTVQFHSFVEADDRLSLVLSILASTNFAVFWTASGFVLWVVVGNPQ